MAHHLAGRGEEPSVTSGIFLPRRQTQKEIPQTVRQTKMKEHLLVLCTGVSSST